MAKERTGQKEGDWFLTTDDNDDLIFTYKNKVVYKFTKDGHIEIKGNEKTKEE